MQHRSAAALGTAGLLVLAGLPASAVRPSPSALSNGAYGQHFDLSAARSAGLDRPAERPGRLPDRVLVLLVDFPDRPGSTGEAAIDSLFFGRAQTPARGGASVREFYRRSSTGRLVIEGGVVPWIRLPQSFTYYADSEHQGLGVRGAYPRNARRLVEDAVRAADARLDYRQWDGDGDGRVDALFVVHAGAAAEDGDSRGILSHTWTTSSVVATADGIGAWSYALVAASSPVGTAAHEFGHLLGLPDLYVSGSLAGRAGGVGDWSLMGSGSWLDGGATPADLDAVCKLELGFVDPLVPLDAAAGLSLRAATATAPGTAYRIWTHGIPASEFFVLENRQPRGQDAALPGGGMLVYHVDLGAADNDDLNRPRVEVLQADGRQDIEGRLNNGDGGDPYPGGIGRLDAATWPSTRARDGSDSQVRIGNISIPTPVMTFDLVLSTRPHLAVEVQELRELQGDGDGLPESGERLALELVLRNDGTATGPLAVRAAARPAADATWGIDTVNVPPIDRHGTGRLQFELVPASGLMDPYGLAIDLALQSAAWTDTLERVVAVGERTGFQACFAAPQGGFTSGCSDPAGPWDVEALAGPGAWTLESRPGEFGQVWRSARGSRYGNGVDVVLVSPSFVLEPGSTLALLHAYDTEDDDAGFAFDGGRVECAVDGGPWEEIVPQGGYPRCLHPRSVVQWSGAFAGRSERRWDTFGLGPRRGSARLRFRFASGDSVGGAGWEIARVAVWQGAAPEAPFALTVVAEPNPVRFPARVAFRVTASLTAPGRPTNLLLYDVRGRLVRVLAHAPVPAESAYFTWDGTDGDGIRVGSGVYFARLEWGDAHAATKLLVLR